MRILLICCFSIFFMKPLDFVFPSYWNRNIPLFLDCIYFLPKPHLLSITKNYFLEFNEIIHLLTKNRSIICELCSGNGDWIIDQAKKNNHYFWIAVERRLDRVKKIWSKKVNYSVENLLIIYGEAFSFFSNFVLDNSFYKIFINFPDPWPKKKHIKNRLINNSFVNEVDRILVRQGFLSLITDDLEFLDYSLMFLTKNLRPCFPKPYYIVQEKFFGQSWFEILWRNKGKKIYYSEFTKKKLLNANFGI